MAKLLLSIFAATVLFGTLAALYLAGNDKFLELKSPDGTYSVILNGDPERPMLLTNTVSFDVLKNGSPYVQNAYLHSGDFMDASFAAGYPESEWMNSSTLRFFRPGDQVAPNKIRVSIENNSGRHIRFVKLFTSDKFILLDLADGATIDLQGSPPGGDSIGFYIEGQYGDGQWFENGANFQFEMIEDISRQYSIVIADDVVTISSQ